MTTLGELAAQVRSKNAGPFWMTIDLFFNEDEAYERASHSVVTDPATVGRLYATDPGHVRVYRLPLLRAIKVSLPAPSSKARSRTATCTPDSNTCHCSTCPCQTASSDDDRAERLIGPSEPRASAAQHLPVAMTARSRRDGTTSPPGI